MNLKKVSVFLLSLLLSLSLAGCPLSLDSLLSPAPTLTLDTLPAYSGEPCVVLEGGIPAFSDDELALPAFESYSPLDLLGRCGTAFALVGPETMPEEEREGIGMVTPSGWHTVRYDDLIEGKYLYNRCHLIGYQLTGENANEENLITGTRYMNVEGMLPYENAVAEYIRESGNHVLYRVTPIFEGVELVARGVVMEARSVEDDALAFHVYAYNVQPGITIDYLTGESRLSEETAPHIEIPPAGVAQPSPEEAEPPAAAPAYILNKSSLKFHLPSCEGVKTMSEKNKEAFFGSREDAIAAGYSPCGTCKP